MPKSTPVPTDWPVGDTITFKAGPTAKVRSGTITGHEGQFIVVNVEGKTLKTRPGAVVS